MNALEDRFISFDCRKGKQMLVSCDIYAYTIFVVFEECFNNYIECYNDHVLNSETLLLPSS